MEQVFNAFKIFFKFLLGTAAILIAALLFVMYFGVTETKYRCDGQIASAPTSSTRIVFLKLRMYKPWMFWTNSGGMAWTEVPNKELEYYSKVSVIGDFIHISSDYSKGYGSFSTLSEFIQLETADGSFEGECKRVEPNT